MMVNNVICEVYVELLRNKIKLKSVNGKKCLFYSNSAKYYLFTIKIEYIQVGDLFYDKYGIFEDV